MENDKKHVERLEKRVYDLKSLMNLGLSLSSNLNFESLVESILYSCIGQMFVDKIAIFVQVDIDESDLYVHMAKGYDREFEKEDILFKEDSSLLQYMAANPEPVLFEDLKTYDKVKSEVEKLSMLSPHLIVPMKSKNSLNGFLTLGEKITGDYFMPTDLDFMQDLAKFAAIAVENSLLYLMAILDRMTRLYIHHYFQERLIEEISRSQRTNIPLSIIMSDIDHFKKFNDTYGHQQGDIVLKKTAELFKNAVRNVDIAARYGGEEFSIILPNTTLDGAILVANRLREKIETTEYPGQEEPLSVTSSFGVAQYNAEKDESSKDLIKRADTALYKAKEEGRNKVVAHGSK